MPWHGPVPPLPPRNRKLVPGTAFSSYATALPYDAQRASWTSKTTVLTAASASKTAPIAQRTRALSVLQPQSAPTTQTRRASWREGCWKAVLEKLELLKLCSEACADGCLLIAACRSLQAHCM